MTNTDKLIAEEILRAQGLSASKLGLRFDRVALRVLGDLRSFVDTTAPRGVTVLLTLSAPIRLPAQTTQALKRHIAARLAAGAPRDDPCATICGNTVCMRFPQHASNGTPKLIGFVHNPGSAPEALLDLAELWLRAQA